MEPTQEMEEEFRNWMSEQPSNRSKHGETFTSAAVGNYSKALNDIEGETTLRLKTTETIESNNLFYYDTLESFLKVKNIILNAQNFKTVNEEFRNRAFSAAIGVYERFLKHRTSSHKTITVIQKSANQKDFEIWLSKQINSNGTYFTTNTINTYCNALKYSVRKLHCSSELQPTIFDYSYIDSFRDDYVKIKSDVNFQKIDQEAGNKAFSVGLDWYGKFLLEKNSTHNKDLIIEEPEQEYTIQEETNTANNNKYTKQDFLNEVFLSEEKYNTLVALLQRKKNLILQGAPGVGKTYLAKRLAQSLIGQQKSEQIMTVQFHQSYSYEDFIMGYRPNGNGFTLTEGPFYTFCKKAQVDSQKNYYFIIDEINRGNVSKIFGELFMLIEHDKRGENGEQIALLYKDELFYVPENVYIIGMMNTADRSLAMLDYALRRRFAFFELKPAFDSDGFENYQLEKNSIEFDRLITKVQDLNKDITLDDSLGSGFRIGHSYFVTQEQITSEWIYSIINYELIPLLQEYWFDEPSKIEKWTKEFNQVM